MIPNLTIHMMIKNEERYIRQTLRSVLPYVEQAIIIDTGSDDKTYDYAEEVCAEYQSTADIMLARQPIAKDSRNWDGNHLNQDLTDLRNQMLSQTDTDWIWQVDGDEIYPEKSIDFLAHAMAGLEMSNYYKGIMVPIKWCVSDDEYVMPGPFNQTLRVFAGTGYWQGEFPNEFYWVDNKPITIEDDRCVTSFGYFLHMSMALHPERRPPTGRLCELIEEEKKCLNI